MSAKMYQILLMLFAVTILTACSKECKPKIEYRDKIKEVKIAVKCDVTMPICNFNKPTGTEVLSELFNCIGLLKIELRKCK